MAPEVEEHLYSNKCDLYSLGIILYYLKTGEYIFEGKYWNESKVNKYNNKIKKDTDDPILNDLIRKLVVINPEERINWENYFNHPFFKVNDDEKEIKINDNNLITLGKYKYEEKIIGKGGFGRVFKGIDENNNPIAIKQIDLEDDNRQETINLIKNEINIMKTMQKNNEYSVKCLDSIEKNCYYYIIMEYCDTTLAKKIKEEKGLKLNTIQMILRQLNINLKKLNDELNIIHKDIKPENILIKYKDEKNNLFDIKLNDYGLSKELSKTYSSEKRGDPRYMAPEGRIYKLNKKSDLWSIGILIYQMYFNELPYLNGELCIKKSGNSEFDDLISKLIVIDHHKRIDWKNYFEHNFFKKNIK
jgi:serine/threonine protein kinase